MTEDEEFEALEQRLNMKETKMNIYLSKTDFLEAENKRLHALNQELLEALELALFAHGKMLLSDPPQEAWKTYEVESKARAAIAIVSVGADPAPCRHVRDVVHARCRRAALHRQRPLAVAVDQPPIGGRRVVQPAATAFRLLRRGLHGHGCQQPSQQPS